MSKSVHHPAAPLRAYRFTSAGGRAAGCERYSVTQWCITELRGGGALQKRRGFATLRRLGFNWPSLGGHQMHQSTDPTTSRTLFRERRPPVLRLLPQKGQEIKRSWSRQSVHRNVYSNIIVLMDEGHHLTRPHPLYSFQLKNLRELMYMARNTDPLWSGQTSQGPQAEKYRCGERVCASQSGGFHTDDQKKQAQRTVCETQSAGVF